MSAVKRTKLTHIRDKTALKPNRPKHSKPRALTAHPVRLSELTWKAVSIPNELGDYEGLYELEEIDDVEVLRDDTTGKVSFHAKNPKKSEVLEMEWNGFSDDEAEAMAIASADESEPTEDGAAMSDSCLTPEDENITEWRKLGLRSRTLSAIAKLKFPHPTPIQSAAIPDILAGQDVIGKASTGSGKTLTYGVPILDYYLRSKSPRRPLSLILAPTRELAHQIGRHLNALCSNNAFRCPGLAIITGGLSIQKQERIFPTADIVIATPGRLWEFMSTSSGVTEKLKQIQFLVIDEADRLLSAGHFQEFGDIITALERIEDNEDQAKSRNKAILRRQTLVFSATFHKGLQQKLSSRGRPNGDLMTKRESLEYLLSKLPFRSEKPKFLDVNPVSQLAEGLKEGLIECSGTEKDLYLYSLLLLHPPARTLVFANSLSTVRRLAPYLENLNFPVHVLHSKMIQKARLRAIERFSRSESSILISTDVAARGLDIQRIQLVIHYHLPRTSDIYVHRSGRTARAENKGATVLLCSPEEAPDLRRLVTQVHSQGGRSLTKNAIRSVDIDRQMVSRLRPRCELAKRIADVGIAKEKGRAEDNFFRNAAEDLGVDYDSEELQNAATGWRGRGSGRRRKKMEDRGVDKAQIARWRAELKSLLAQRVNVGVSERYLAGGQIDVDQLIRGEKSNFLGKVLPLRL